MSLGHGEKPNFTFIIHRLTRDMTLTPEILYEDNHLIIANKPFGVLTHSDKTGDMSLEEVVKQYIKVKYKKPGNVYCKAIHRLDRPVSGVILFARTSKAHERMALQFKNREVHKTYWALTARKPNPPVDTVKHYLRKDSKTNTVSWSDKSDGSGGREAVTDYKFLRHIDPYYLIQLNPVTGRSHQLRVVLRSKRCPIIGDIKYNGRVCSNSRAILLHARNIKFTHPVKKEPMNVDAPLPVIEEWDYVKALTGFV